MDMDRYGAALSRLKAAAHPSLGTLILDLESSIIARIGVTNDCVVVPVEPTEKMVEAAYLRTHAPYAVLISANPKIIYRAMVAARPNPDERY